MSYSDFPKLRLKQFPKIAERETSEYKYWKSFQLGKEHRLDGAPNTIHFNPVNHSDFLVSSSVKVTLYDGQTDKEQRSYTRFKDEAFSAKFRKDGKLIVAGEKTGYVQVFDTVTKGVLRQMKLHTAAVRATSWVHGGTAIVSGSDDKRVFCWDLATGEQTWSSKAHHTDYVRAISTSPVASEMFMSGGYDHTVKVWDSRQTNPVFSLEHDGPVESVLFLQSGTLMLSTSGNEIKIWDVLNSGRLLHTFNNHLKNITSLCTTNGDKKLLSSGLDGLVKVYDMQTLQVVHSMKYDTPVMCVSVSPRDKKLVIGCTNGQLLIKNKRVDSDSNDTDIGIGVTNILRKNRLYKGAGVANGTIDGQTRTGVIETERTSRLLPYEKFLQKFNYQKALDAALKTRNPLVVITVFEELCRRSGLTIALSGREDVSLEPIVSFCARYINNPRYSRVLIQVTHKVLDLYANVLGHSDAIDQLFMKLQKQVKVEVQFQREIMRVMGSLDGIISAAMNGSSAIDSAIDNATNNTTNLIGNNDNMALISSFN